MKMMFYLVEKVIVLAVKPHLYTEVFRRLADQETIIRIYN